MADNPRDPVGMRGPLTNQNTLKLAVLWKTAVVGKGKTRVDLQKLCQKIPGFGSMLFDGVMSLGWLCALRWQASGVTPPRSYFYLYVPKVVDGELQGSFSFFLNQGAPSEKLSPEIARVTTELLRRMNHEWDLGFELLTPVR